MATKMEVYEAETCRRIVNLLETQGYILTMDEAYRLWQVHSNDYCAGWLITTPDDKFLLAELMKLVKVADGNEVYFQSPMRGYE